MLGGPVARKTLYCFGAAQGSRSEPNHALSCTRGNYSYAVRELRFQLKGPWTPSQSHTIKASHIRVNNQDLRVTVWWSLPA